jgi:hypothetical protein
METTVPHGGPMKICLLILMLLLFLSNSSAGYCQIDGPIAKEAVKKDTLALLSSSQFKKLEENAKRYSVKKERFPDGGWKLYSLFDAFQYPPYQTDSSWKKHLGLLESWQAAYPASDAAKSALAGAWIGYAWFARGADSSIKDGGYPLMVDRLGKAETILKKVSPSYIPALLLKLQLAVANSASKSEFQTLLKKALSVEPSYVPFYSAAIMYYLPRWHGEPGEWVQQLERFDQTAPRKEGIYARVAFGYLGIEWNSFSEGTIKWEKMKKSLNEITYSSPWIDNMAASCSCLAGDYKMARVLLKKIGPNVYYPAWKNTSPDACRQKAGLPGEFKGVDTSVDYQYMEELSKNNNLWATELLKKWKKLNMVGVTY